MRLDYSETGLYDCENKGIDSAVRRPAVYYIGCKVYA